MTARRLPGGGLRKTIVALDTWRTVFVDPVVRRSFWVTGRYVLLAMPILIVTPLLMAVRLNARMLPGTAQPYGYLAVDGGDGLITVVNPAQATVVVPLPVACPDGAVIFRDAGFMPQVTATTVTLGPEQMVVIGVGRYAGMDWGGEADVTIPAHIAPLPVEFVPHGTQMLHATLTALPQRGRLRVVMQQFDAHGRVVRTSGGAPPAGVTLAQLLRIEARQGEQALPVTITYDKAIWSGLSWAVGEIDLASLAPAAPLDITLTTTDPSVHMLQGRLYHVLEQA